MSWKEDEATIDKAISEFPSVFGLRANPGRLFRISRENSFVSQGQVFLYTQIQNSDGSWNDFAKGSPNELRSQMLHFAER